MAAIVELSSSGFAGTGFVCGAFDEAATGAGAAGFDFFAIGCGTVFAGADGLDSGSAVLTGVWTAILTPANFESQPARRSRISRRNKKAATTSNQGARVT